LSADRRCRRRRVVVLRSCSARAPRRAQRRCARARSGSAPRGGGRAGRASRLCLRSRRRRQRARTAAACPKRQPLPPGPPGCGRRMATSP